ncbi:MAG: hypothetical protein ISS56_14820 [Anaerolineae bacterium]|nr:hypothetical protein [Anaerolineae bacterium]
MPISRHEARELTSRGYEMRATVLNGTLCRQQDGTWVVDERSVDESLQALEGQQVILVVSAIQEGAGRARVCPVCGSEYDGYECTHCRQVRRRLRGP